VKQIVCGPRRSERLCEEAKGKGSEPPSDVLSQAARTAVIGKNSAAINPALADLAAIIADWDCMVLVMIMGNSRKVAHFGQGNGVIADPFPPRTSPTEGMGEAGRGRPYAVSLYRRPLGLAQYERVNP
jgi:hypothetical protein